LPNGSCFFETEGKDDWMGRHFFTGGVMPSQELLLQFQQDLVIEDLWTVPGIHYARTLEDWLGRCDERHGQLLPLFQSDLGLVEGKRHSPFACTLGAKPPRDKRTARNSTISSVSSQGDEG
jgi:hypothetical protein